MKWTFEPTELKTTHDMFEAWKQGLEAQGKMDYRAWEEQATQLRTLVAVLRDSLLPFSEDHAALVSLVHEISNYLPERRQRNRPAEEEG